MNPTDTAKPIVLCVDDDPPVLAALARALRREPYEVITTDDPEEALEILERSNVRVIIADQRMPQLAGTELLKKVRRHSPATARMILTAYPDTTAIRERIHQGAHRLLTKPWKDEELKRTIRELLAPPHPSEHDGGRVSRKESPDLLDIVLRAECAEQTAVDLLAQITREVETTEAARRGVTILFDGFPRLRGSAPAFLHQLVGWATAWDVRLTLVDPSGHAEAAWEAEGSPASVWLYGPPARRRCALVVSSSPECTDVLSLLIQSPGHACDVVRSAAEVRGRAASNRYDVVFLDLALEDAEAVVVARALAASTPPAAIVALCTWPDLWSETLSSHLGIRRPIKKPYRARTILDLLEES